MKKFIIIAFIGVFAFAFACGTTPEVKQEVAPSGSIVNVQNEQLARIPVEGFDYKSSKVPPQKWDKWATAAAPVVKGVIDKLPEGYVLQVTGHTDARGPEGPVGAKPGNTKISTDRAKAVFDALKAKGVTSPKMTYKGVGSSELLPGVDPNDAQQRRVTFKVVPQK
ncbi:MAG: OmpA family protein [Spirochaetes bacterium]|jgi:outer membrane protein OmpA-like peptidoglycan-associated protein|nr:OmpA family protein [Spirochaetota bacterium]